MDYPAGAIQSKEEFVDRVRANGRQKKTLVYFVTKGGVSNPFSGFQEIQEFIWPLKFVDELEGDPRFVADVRGEIFSMRDRHIMPNEYNYNFAFFDPNLAKAYLDTPIEVGNL